MTKQKEIIEAVLKLAQTIDTHEMQWIPDLKRLSPHFRSRTTLIKEILKIDNEHTSRNVY